MEISEFSLGIEFDTYYNGNLNDMYPDHIAIHRDGNTNHSSPNALAGPVQADPDDIDIEDGEDHAISITWDPFSQEIRVYFDCQFRLSTSIDLVNSIFGGETNVWWGFSASTVALTTFTLYASMKMYLRLETLPFAQDSQPNLLLEVI